jgi:Tfp pilus assembly protein PilN
MNQKNLLPAHRQSALQRRRAIRRWTLINGVYLGLLLMAGVAYAYGTLSPRSPGEAASNLNELNSTLVSVRQQTTALNINLRAAQEITERPDWSILLAVLADSLGDDVVLEAVDVPAPADPAGPLPQPQRLRLVAQAQSQAAATQFVLRLEALRLFSRVQLEKTTTTTARGGTGVRFQVNCRFAEDHPR